MIRLLMFVVCLTLALPSIAQDGMTPRVSQWLSRITERAAQEPESALEDLDRLAKSRGLSEVDRGFVIREQAALLLQLERTAEARELVRNMLIDKPDDYLPFLRILLAQILLIENRASEALPLLETWMRYTQNPPAAELSLLGYSYMQAERYEDAVVIFERILDLTENVNDQWVELLAYAYTQTGQSENAVALLNEVIARDPAQSRWWKQLSNIFNLIEQFESGAASLSIVEILGGLSYEDSRRLAGLFSLLGIPMDGARVLTTTLEHNPQFNNFEDMMLVGELYLLAREIDLAIATFETASSMAGTGEPKLKIAQLHLQWERYSEARQALAEAIALYGDSAPEQVWYLLGIVEINLGNLQAAQDSINRIDTAGAYADRAQNLNHFIQNRQATVVP